ncbi:MAG: hypothetical protein KatS3mg034_0772 [Vicingaceae bacterium]|nr:MAG: hypothetical protein KatS3mg034_0772 [Vicingaceae bacterium]
MAADGGSLIVRAPQPRPAWACSDLPAVSCCKSLHDGLRCLRAIRSPPAAKHSTPNPFIKSLAKSCLPEHPLPLPYNF